MAAVEHRRSRVQRLVLRRNAAVREHDAPSTDVTRGCGTGWHALRRSRVMLAWRDTDERGQLLERQRGEIGVRAIRIEGDMRRRAHGEHVQAGAPRGANGCRRVHERHRVLATRAPRADEVRCRLLVQLGRRRRLRARRPTVNTQAIMPSSAGQPEEEIGLGARGA